MVERFRFGGRSRRIRERNHGAERSPIPSFDGAAGIARGPGIRRGLSAIRLARVSAGANVRRLGTLASRTGIEFHLLTILKGTEPFRNDVAVMNKQILAPIVGSDEPVPLLVTEPLYGATSQDFPPPDTLRGLSYMVEPLATI